MPQSITYAARFLMITWADAELDFRGRGPPPVPSRMSFVLVDWPSVRYGGENARSNVAVPARNARRLQRARQRAASQCRGLHYQAYPARVLRTPPGSGIPSRGGRTCSCICPSKPDSAVGRRYRTGKDRYRRQFVGWRMAEALMAASSRLRRVGASFMPAFKLQKQFSV